MKATLVIDMPDECLDCPCYRQTYTYNWGLAGEDCKAMLRPLNYIEVTNRPEWCPLKPLPTRPDVIPIKEEEAYVYGWNDCLKEIEE